MFPPWLAALWNFTDRRTWLRRFFSFSNNKQCLCSVRTIKWIKITNHETRKKNKNKKKEKNGLAEVERWEERICRFEWSRGKDKWNYNNRSWRIWNQWEFLIYDFKINSRLKVCQKILDCLTKMPLSDSVTNTIGTFDFFCVPFIQTLQSVYCGVGRMKLFFVIYSPPSAIFYPSKISNFDLASGDECVNVIRLQSTALVGSKFIIIGYYAQKNQYSIS